MHDFLENVLYLKPKMTTLTNVDTSLHSNELVAAVSASVSASVCVCETGTVSEVF